MKGRARSGPPFFLHFLPRAERVGEGDREVVEGVLGADPAALARQFEHRPEEVAHRVIADQSDLSVSLSSTTHETAPPPLRGPLPHSQSARGEENTIACCLSGEEAPTSYWP